MGAPPSTCTGVQLEGADLEGLEDAEEPNLAHVLPHGVEADQLEEAAPHVRRRVKADAPATDRENPL